MALLYIDTADINEIKRFLELGLVDGVTTNPTLAAKAGFSDMHDAAKKIAELVRPRPVSIEVLATSSEEMVKEAVEYTNIAKNIEIKIPCTEEGLKAMAPLTERGINVNATLVFSPLQAYACARRGAKYVSIFVGRLGDIGHDGIAVIKQTKKIFEIYGFKTKVLAASIRTVDHVLQALLAGADVITVPPKVLEKLYKHPKTDEGLQKFLEDWASCKK